MLFNSGTLKPGVGRHGVKQRSLKVSTVTTRKRSDAESGLGIGETLSDFTDSVGFYVFFLCSWAATFVPAQESLTLELRMILSRSQKLSKFFSNNVQFFSPSSPHGRSLNLVQSENLISPVLWRRSSAIWVGNARLCARQRLTASNEERDQFGEDWKQCAIKTLW